MIFLSLVKTCIFNKTHINQYGLSRIKNYIDMLLNQHTLVAAYLPSLKKSILKKQEKMNIENRTNLYLK